MNYIPAKQIFQRNGMRKFFFFFISLLLMQSSLSFAQNIKCFNCNKKIIGEYIVIDGRSFHSNHFTCSKCNKPINGNYYKNDGKYFDSNCFSTFIAPKCDVCAQPIDGNYQTDLYGLKYHPYHEKELHRCDNCNMLISQNTSKGGVTYSDGRKICNICKEKAVSTEAQYSRSLQKIISQLKNYGLVLDLQNVDIFAVDRNKLKEVSNRNYSNSARGYCQVEILKTSSGTDVKINKSYKIYVLDRIPAKYIESTIAHELMHVWISENVTHKLSSQLEEGSCNFISYTYLKSDYSTDAQSIIKQLKDDPDNTYGDGFRKVYNRFSGRYLSEFLSYLKKNKTI